MAKLSLGKAKGNTSRRTSQRVQGGAIGQQSGTTPFQTFGLDAPAVESSSVMADIYMRPTEPMVPEAPVMGAYRTPPEPTSIGQTERLAASLGAFNKNLIGLTEETIAAVGRREKRLKAEAEEAAAGTVFGTQANSRLREVTEELEQVKNDPEATPEERRQAEESLTRVQAEINNNPHYESALRKLQVQKRAVGAPAWVKSSPTVATDDGREITLDQLPPSSPEFKRAYSEYVYGGETLTPREARKLQPVLLQSLSAAEAAQAAKHKAYQKSELQQNTNQQINLAVSTYENGGNYADLAESLQDIFEPFGAKGMPMLTRSERAEMQEQAVEGIVAALENVSNRPKSWTEVESLLGTLMVGPVQDRVIDGVVNDKLRYITMMDPEKLADLEDKWERSTSTRATYNKQRTELQETLYVNEEVSALYDVIEYGEDGIATRVSMQTFEENKFDLISKIQREHADNPLKATRLIKQVNEVTKQYPQAWRKDMLRDYDFQLNQDLDILMEDPSDDGIALERIERAYKEGIIDSKKYNKDSDSVREIIGSTYKEPIKSMKALIADAEKSYVDGGVGSLTPGGGATDIEVRLFEIAKPQMMRDGRALMRQLRQQGALDEFPARYGALLENNQLKYGLYKTVNDPGYIEYQSLDDLQKAHNQGIADGSLELRAQSPLPILSQQAIGDVMDMVSSGKPLPPYVADAVRAYGGLRPFIESELIKNNVNQKDAQSIAGDQPAEFYEIELEEDAPAVQEVSMVDRLVGGSIAALGMLLPGAPAQATVLPPPPVTRELPTYGAGPRQQAIVAAAKQVGIRPIDLAAAMSYETIGSFDPSITNQLGYSGLIQFSPDNQRTYGVNADSTFAEQAQAAARYLKDRGVRPGDGINRIYAAILVGNADGKGPNGEDYMDAEDVNGNSVNSALKDLLPGGGHYQNANRFLRGE